MAKFFQQMIDTLFFRLFELRLIKDASDQVRWSLLEKSTLCFIALIPFGYFLIPSWLSNCTVIAAILAVITLSISKDSLTLSKEAKLACLIFLAYPLAIFLSQLIRWEWRLHDYHDQSRFLLGLPIFLFLIKKKLNLSRYLSWALPCVLFISTLSAFWLNNTNYWGDRLTVSFIDPLAFGLTNLTLGLLCLACLTWMTWQPNNRPIRIWLLLGFIVGTFLSIQSQSRTGLLSLLIVPPILLSLRYQIPLKKAAPLTLFTAAALATVLFFASPIVQSRLIEAYQDFVTYPWHGKLDHMTSLGWRITFWRIGWFYFTQSPIWGWGDKGFTHLMNAPEITVFATREAIEFCYRSLFHNEVITQAVRYGFIGLSATSVVFGLSAYYFWKYRKTQNSQGISAGILGITYLTCQFIAGMSDEVFNLKHLVTIATWILAVLLASALNEGATYNQESSN